LSGFKAIGVWSLNLKAMDDKTRPSSLYTTREDNCHINENIRNSNDARNDIPQWGNDTTTSELMIMGTIDIHDVGNHNVTNW
jgi:hypothetical protein